jgi:protein-S-isoprenylcysteine O-methyltransferase Ste14
MDDRPPLWAVIGTIVFTLLVPGSAIGLVPYYLLSGWRLEPPLLGWSPWRWAGAALFLVAAPIFLAFLVRFVREGHGTPAPIAPTRHLVVGGPFRYVRNPGYASGIAMIVGQGLFFGSGAVLVYAAVMALGFHLFVLLYEEPTLRRTFGAEYDAYCREVPRWLPRLRPYARRSPIR